MHLSRPFTEEAAWDGEPLPPWPGPLGGVQNPRRPVGPSSSPRHWRTRGTVSAGAGNPDKRDRDCRQLARPPAQRADGASAGLILTRHRTGPPFGWQTSASGSGPFCVTLHLRFPRLPGAGRGAVGELLVGEPSRAEMQAWRVP
ncbi:hypothetical protein NN561_011599 [Cricetulus griseus]